MALRMMVDGDGCTWTVWATYPKVTGPRDVQAEYGAGWLTFQCDAEKRRLMPVPGDWEDEPEARLLVYLQAAVVIAPSRKLRGGA